MAEDFDERMAASQRAYADIILNTAKESAARVLLAERRVVQLEQSLSMAKEESLALLVRVKAIMDSKIKEAEKVNLSQARKIQALESQLTEAKGTIECLRSELERLNSKLDCIYNNQPEGLGNQEAHDDFLFKKNIFHEKKHCSNLVTFPCGGSTPSSDTRNKAGNCLLAKGSRRSISLKDMTASEDCTGKPDFASMILRNKETRNGCTQRIRAFDQNLLTNRESPANSHHQKLKMERGTVIYKNRKAKRLSFLDSATTDGGLMHQKKPLKSKQIGRPSDNCGNGQMLKFVGCHVCKNQRSRRRRRIMKPICFETSDDIAEQDMSENAEMPSGAGDQSQSCDILYAAIGGKSETSRISQLHREDSEITNDGKLDSVNVETVGHSNINRTVSQGIAMEHSDTYVGKHADRSPLSSTWNECVEGNGKEPIPVSTCHVNTDEDVKNVLGANAEEGMNLTTENLTIEENLAIAVMKDLEPDLESFNSKNREDTPSDPLAEAGSERVLKYTFRRKRKRECLDKCLDKKDFVSSAEKNPKRKAEKEKASVEPQKHTSVLESSRDSRRLAQVARQLISLSEKRWW